MSVCPNCGSLVLEGDPYCEHCGTHLSWSEDCEYTSNKDDDLDDLLNYLFIDGARKILLKNKLETYLKAKDAKKLQLRQALNEYVFEITRQNEYIKTVDEFYYDPKYENPTHVFADCIQNHNYDALKSNPDFKALVKKIGKPVYRIICGYVTEYTSWPREFNLIDRIEVRVQFKFEDKIRSYNLNLENMKFSGEPYECRY